MVWDQELGFVVRVVFALGWGSLPYKGFQGCCSFWVSGGSVYHRVRVVPMSSKEP